MSAATLPLELREIENHLKHLQYKPGWTFEIQTDLSYRPCLLVSFIAEDAYNPGRETKIGFREALYPYYRGTKQFEEWLFGVIMKIERHEAREFFKRDGEIINDPHKHKGDAI